MRLSQRTKNTAVIVAGMATILGMEAVNEAHSAPAVALATGQVGTYPASYDDPPVTRHGAPRPPVVAATPSTVRLPAVASTATAIQKKKTRVKTVRQNPSVKTAGWMQRFARCVMTHESHGNYKAENPTSTASGAYQFIDGTWRNYAQRLGYGYRHASYAPPAVQDAVFFYVISHGGVHNWNGTHCGFGT